jgi:hypothetical protein
MRARSSVRKSVAARLAAGRSTRSAKRRSAAGGPSAPVSAGGSSSGRTADSDSANLGSNPSPPAIHTWRTRCVDRFRQRRLMPDRTAPITDRGSAAEFGALLKYRCARPLAAAQGHLGCESLYDRQRQPAMRWRHQTVAARAHARVGSSLRSHCRVIAREASVIHPRRAHAQSSMSRHATPCHSGRASDRPPTAACAL